MMRLIKDCSRKQNNRTKLANKAVKLLNYIIIDKLYFTFLSTYFDKK